MIAARLCQLHETFQREWIRDFPNCPLAVLDGIDDVIKTKPTLSETACLVSTVNERLVVTNDKITTLLEQLHREVVVKQFLFRVLEILDSGIDFSAQLATICSQICILDNWSSPLTLAGYGDKAPQPKCIYSESFKLNSTFGDKKHVDRSNTLPRLCYSSANKTSKVTKDAERIVINTCSNLGELSESDEMFRRKKNTQKSNDDSDSGSHILGAKDNFLAVKSKHIEPSVFSRHQDGINSSPHLTRNFQMLKLTDGFDLVLGDSSVRDDKKSEGQHLQGDIFTKSDSPRGKSYPEKPARRIKVYNKTDNDHASSEISLLSENNVNITTIQIRKPEVRNRRSDLGSKDYATGSEVTANRQEPQQHSHQEEFGSGGYAPGSEVTGSQVTLTKKTSPQESVRGPGSEVTGSQITATKQTFSQESVRAPGSEVTCSRITATKQTSQQESFTSVRTLVSDSDGSFDESSLQTVHNFHERIGHSQSFQNSLRKFSTKGSAVPPPVAKKPTRAGSSNKLPSSPIEGSVAGFQNFVVDSSVGGGGVSNSQSILEFNDAKVIRVLNRSRSVEGIGGVDSRKVPSGKNEFEGIISTTEVQVPEEVCKVETLDTQPLLQTGGNSEKDCGGVETEVTRDNDSKELFSLQSGETLVTNEITRETEEMSFYRLKKPSGNSSHRNSIENLVEGIGYSVININKRFEDDSKSLSPPEIPCKMPIHASSEIDSNLSRTEVIHHITGDHRIFVSSASKEAEDVVFDCESNLPHGVKDVPDTRRNANRSEKPSVVEFSPETKKRLSSTPSYENWTINRAITTSIADCVSVSDDDELDDAPSSPVTASPSNEQHVVSTSSKDSGLCDDISSSDVSHNDSDVVSIRGREQRVTPQVEHHSPDLDEQALLDTVYLETDLTNEVSHVRAPERSQRPRQREEDITDTLSVDALSLDTVSMPSDGDEETVPSMDSSCDETDSARDGMLKMRQLLVKGVLDSEKSYLATLSKLLDYKRYFEASTMSSQPLISKEDIQTIFSNIETVNNIHTEFVDSLEAKVVNWTHGEKVGEIFKIMISKLIDFGNYLNNYQLAVSTIHRCCQESEKFSELALKMVIKSTTMEVTTLEAALFKPVQRVQRNTLVLHDLMKYTPEDHPDYNALLKAQKLSQHIIENFATLIPQSVNTQENRRLVKSSFLVEDVGGVRKLRFIFLFSDVLVCTKREIRRNNKVTFDIKWFAPLTQSSIDTKFTYNDDGKMSKDDIGELKSKLKSLKRELKAEIRKSDDKDRHRTLVNLGGGAARNVEKLRKKMNQAEAQLILASPKLPFKVLIDGGRPYTLLMSTDYEREEWKETIAALFRKVSRADQPTQTMSSIYIQELINNVKETPQVNKIGNVLLKKDEDLLTGILNVTIHKVNGLTTACDTYCNIEMDSFGHFFFKARTTVCEQTQDPAWNEDFDLELEGSETLRILCFKKEPGGQGDTLLGRGALELSQQWLKGSFLEKTLSMNEISLVISMRHIPADKTMQRTPSRTSTAVFGVSISSCAKREGKTVPMIVTACVQEVEKRGLVEVGIYRVSGVSSDLQNIKKIIDKNARAGTVMLQDADIHSVTGVLKLYLRELPEPLFTEANYNSFVATLKLSDDEAKTQCMLGLLHGLPDTNYYTIVYLLEHLIKVAKQVGVNKMSIHNLSTIFGPTLLAPATKQTSSDPLEMMCKGAEEVMHQSSIVNFLLGLAFSDRSLRRSAQ